jgi:beta-xylosidase
VSHFNEGNFVMKKNVITILVACALTGATAVCVAQTQRGPAGPGRAGFGRGFGRGMFSPPGPPAPVPPEVAMPRPTLEEVAKINAELQRFIDTDTSDNLAFRWIGLRAPTSKWYAISKAAKALFLEPRADLLSGQGNPSYLAVRQQNNDFTCAVTLTAQPETANCVAGLAAFQNERHYYAINVKIDSGRLTEVSLEQSAGGFGRGFRRGGQAQPEVLASQQLPDNVASIDLKVEGTGPSTRAFYIGNGEFTRLGEDLQSSFLSTDTAGGFQGVTLGMFARS